ncbi:MAG: 50S ribosomal protein L9 [Eubacteriales bacterium]
MEIILLEDVKKLGNKGEVVKVNDGYARNYIIPKKLGVEATNQSKNELNLKRQAEEKRKKEILEEAKKLAEQINNSRITIKVKAGEGGRLFGSVSSKEIVKTAKEQINLKIDKKKMQLIEPIRTLGTTIVPIKVHPKVTAELKVKVIEDN